MNTSEAFSSYRRSNIGALLFATPVTAVIFLGNIINIIYVVPILIVAIVVIVASRFSFKFATISGILLALGLILKEQFKSPFVGGMFLLGAIIGFAIFAVFEVRRRRS